MPANGNGRNVSRYRSQMRGAINRNTVASLALERGYDVYLPVHAGGVDLVLLHRDSGKLIKVQLKGRWTIERKYLGREIWIAFPIDGDWYLMEHDRMVELGDRQGYTRNPSWTEKGIWNIPSPSKAVRESCAPYKFAPIDEVEEDAASAEEDAASAEQDA